MKPQTPDQAAARFCPFTFGDQRGASTCLAGRCMAWRIVHERVEREDHSGARDVMNKHALDTRRHVSRKGPQGSSGILILEEVGVCARLNPSPAWAGYDAQDSH